MPRKNTLAPIRTIETCILLVRGQKVILDNDLATLYGVPTGRLNEQVKRHAARFPGDFMFRLTWDEARSLRSQFAILDDSPPQQEAQTTKPGRGNYAKYRPCAFTEHGAIMAANVLNSEQAVRVSVLVVRAFVKLREMIGAHQELAHKIDELDKRLDTHDDAILGILETIKLLMEPVAEPKRKLIGFDSEKEDN